MRRRKSSFVCTFGAAGLVPCSSVGLEEVNQSSSAFVELRNEVASTFPESSQRDIDYIIDNLIFGTPSLSLEEENFQKSGANPERLENDASDFVPFTNDDIEQDSSGQVVNKREEVIEPAKADSTESILKEERLLEKVDQKLESLFSWRDESSRRIDSVASAVDSIKTNVADVKKVASDIDAMKKVASDIDAKVSDIVQIHLDNATKKDHAEPVESIDDRIDAALGAIFGQIESQSRQSQDASGGQEIPGKHKIETSPSRPTRKIVLTKPSNSTSRVATEISEDKTLASNSFSSEQNEKSEDQLSGSASDSKTDNFLVAPAIRKLIVYISFAVFPWLWLMYR